MSLQFESSFFAFESTTSMEDLYYNTTNDTFDESTEAQPISEEMLALQEFLRIFTERAIPALFAVIGIVGLTGTFNMSIFIFFNYYFILESLFICLSSEIYSYTKK